MSIGITAGLAFLGIAVLIGLLSTSPIPTTDGNMYRSATEEILGGNPGQVRVGMSANSFRAGEYVHNGGTIAMGEFPLGYPAAASLFGEADRGQTAVALFATLTLAGAIIWGPRRPTNQTLMVRTAAAVALIALPMWRLTVETRMSDALYVALLVAGGLAAVNRRPRLAAGGAVILGLAGTVRFLGAAVAVVGVLVALWQQHQVRRRWPLLVVAALPGAIAVAWASTTTAHQQLGWYGWSSFDTGVGIRALESAIWTMPRSLAEMTHAAHPLTATVAVLVAVAVLIVGFGHSIRRSDTTAGAHGAAWRVLMAMAATHLTVTVCSILFANALTLPESRQYLPVVELVMIAVVWRWEVHWRRALAGLTTWCLLAAPPWDWWEQSTVPVAYPPIRADIVDLSDPPQFVLTNSPENIYAVTRLPAWSLPDGTNPITAETVDVAHFYANLSCDLYNSGGVVVLFSSTPSPTQFEPADQAWEVVVDDSAGQTLFTPTGDGCELDPSSSTAAPG